MVGSYFELLRTSNKAALLYQSIYFMRRLSLSLILVFLKGFPIIQVFLMIFVSLAFVIYICSVRPFESKILNMIELFNELVILSCLYHMVIFTEVLLEDREVLYLVGWSMDILLTIQFFLNVLFIGYQFLYTVWSMIKRLVITIQKKRILKAKIAQD